MARYIGPKNKLMRKIGLDLGLQQNSIKVAKRIAILPGVHGKKGRRKMSGFGIQLLEKQKVKIIYGVLEKQFRRYFTMAAKNPQATGSVLLSLLERRLDNTVYRLGFAPTRAAARQLVAHGNVKVNGRKLDIPSYTTIVGDIITLTDTGAKIPYIAEFIKQKTQGIPTWLDRQGAAGKVTRLPVREDISEDINEQLIVEYYSK
jgi:small subunit ribosomal protein S4